MNPTLTVTPPDKAALRRAVLERRLRGAGQGIGRSAIGRADRTQLLPLSEGQQRLWFLHRLDQESTEYAVPFALRLTGPLDVAALQRALTGLVRRHEILRTTYRADGDTPHQVICPDATVELPMTDLAGADEEGLTGELTEFVSRPFDLATGPVLRALLIREAPDQHVLALNVHHIACDGWSWPLLRRDLFALYADEDLAEPKVQYADFAAHQRGQGKPDPESLSARYWRDRLAGLEPLELPTDRPRPATRDPRGASIAFTVPAQVAEPVLQAGRQSGATPFITLLAATYVVLGRHAASTDIAVGTPVSGRGFTELEDVVGFFVNTMVARGDISGNPTFRGLVERVRASVLEDFAHQDHPFEDLVRDLVPERDLSHTPLYQVLFAVYEQEQDQERVGNLLLQEVMVPSVSAKCDLTIAFVRQSDGSLRGSLEYATALFDREHMEKVAENFELLLAGAAATPDARLSELDMLSAEDRALLTDEWNATERPYTAGCLHERISEQAARIPDAVAVRCGAQEMTYAELERRAGHLADRLREAGAGVETPVGVLVERGMALLPALLAVLRTGAHYVPLDPAYPHERQEFMLQEAGAQLLVTTSRFRTALPTSTPTVLYADEEVPDGPAEPSAAEVDPDNLAYVIYTSGSTGRPKGVMITHRGVLHYLDWCRQAYRADEGEGAPVHSSLSFDLTVTGLFLPLLCGTTVTLVPEDEHAVTGLANLLSSGRRFSFVKLTPAHLEPLQRCLPDSAADAAAHLVVGGEQLNAEALAFWRDRAPDVVIANEYGHTETSVANVINVLPAGEAVDTPISVGRPIWNTEVYLLDENMRPVPVGATGELYAGGVGVARGFVNRPALTADRYVPNPFGPGRLYRSGDLARYLPDGRLEFVGRTDHQVKVRGYRIELGEIETALVVHPGVNEAVVVARDGALAGYVTPGNVDVSELRAALADRLPGYMVPTTLTALEEMPLTTNGKIDRSKLPEPERVLDDSERVSPRDELELAVLMLWEDLLGASLGVTDNFFRCGGHSLLAVAMVDRLHAKLGLSAGLADVFRAPTVRQLCDVLRTTRQGAASRVVPLSPGRADVAPLFLVPPTAGTPFPYLDLVQALDSDHPVYGLQAVGYSGDEQPLTTIEAIAARYLDDIREVFPEGPIHLAGWSMGGSVAFEMARQWEKAGGEVGHLCIIDATVLGVDAINSPLREVEADEPLDWFNQAVLRLEPDELRELSPQQSMQQALLEARSRGMVSEIAQADSLNRMAGVYLANKEAILAYRCTAVINSDMHLIRTRDVHPEKGRPEVRLESWAQRTRGEVHDVLIPGDHWSINQPPYVAGLAQAMNEGLRSAKRH
ncbi:amino acid adenylation domain-containing protein [Streptomyces tibetensis]|uniref:non-ribosomal peptide synthetase n=1 Tax=Streptomyces tibetensis TaxID=2382123 RepID=UPI0033D70A8A